MPMGTPRLHCVPPAPPSPVPLSPAADLIRTTLASRCQQLAALEPAALDLAARVLEQLHTACWSRQAELRGTHSPEYRRHQLAGAAGLPVEGLCYLTVRAPEAVRGALDVLAAAVGCRLSQLPEAPRSLAREAARLSRAAGETAATIEETLEDGLVEPEELDQVAATARGVTAAAAGLLAAVEAERNRRRR